ncbi:MAG TPA: aminotransferase class IV [Gemmatimonadales bacterium]|nr:aminotransferase class IV [Gemmatimonadales bacterium]
MTALIETVRVRHGRAPLWPYHVERLERSCAALAIPFPLDLAPPVGGDHRVVRYQVSPSDVEVSERAVGSVAPVRLVTARALHQPYPDKTTDRAAFNAALAEAKAAGADDALMLTPEGYVAEGCIWSVFWWEGGRIACPASSLGVLPGVARARLGERVGPLVERHVERGYLDGRPLFVANAARGVVPVAELDGVLVPESPDLALVVAVFWP